jgi:hypothetical protein
MPDITWGLEGGRGCWVSILKKWQKEKNPKISRHIEGNSGLYLVENFPLYPLRGRRRIRPMPFGRKICTYVKGATKRGKFRNEVE